MPMKRKELDELDYQILSLIAENARLPFLEVARNCNVSGAAIHQRVQRLTDLGVIKGSEFVLDPEKVGYETCAFIGLRLTGMLTEEEIVAELMKIPEVVECHCTTGAYDLFVKVYAQNNHHLLSILHEKIQPLGVERTESIISFKETLNRQMPIPTYEFDDDEDDIE